MTDKNLFSAIGNIDEKYIEEAADEERARPRLLALRYVAAAAALLIVVTASIGIFKNLPKKSSLQTEGAFVGLSGENFEPNNLTDSTDITSELVTEGENAEGSKPDDVGSDASTDSKDTASTNFGAQAIPHIHPDSTKQENYSLVQLNFENERFYRYLSNNDISELNIKPINKESLGEKIAVLAPENTTRDSLVGCEVFSHKEIDCDAIIILKNGDELIPFVFLGFRYNDRDFSEILAIHGADDSTDIEKITTRELHASTDNKEAITDAEQIKSVYDVLVSTRNDNGENDEIKNKLHQSDDKTYIYFTLHFKNGLKYQSFYRAYPDTSYIEDHDFLTKEDDQILREILLN